MIGCMPGSSGPVNHCYSYTRNAIIPGRAPWVWM